MDKNFWMSKKFNGIVAIVICFGLYLFFGKDESDQQAFAAAVGAISTCVLGIAGHDAVARFGKDGRVVNGSDNGKI